MAKSIVGRVPRQEELAEVAPPVAPTEALRRSLRYAMLNGITCEDMAEISKAQVVKAKKGDTKAAAFCRDLAIGVEEVRQASPPPKMQQAMVFNNGPTGAGVMSEVRRQLAAAIHAKGPQKTLALVNAVKSSLEVVAAALVDHIWFQQKGGAWHLTVEGLEEGVGI